MSTARGNAFRDAEELLAGSTTFWIGFNEDIENPDRDEVHKQDGLFHWLSDVYLFMVEPNVLALTFGHPTECDQWFYSTDPDLLSGYANASKTVLASMSEIVAQIKRDA